MKMKFDLAKVIPLLAVLALLPYCGEPPETVRKKETLRKPLRTDDGRLILNLRLEEGGDYKLRWRLAKDLVRVSDEKEQNLKQKLGFDYRFRVRKIDNEGNFEVDVTYLSASIEQEDATGRVEYNEKTPPEEIDLSIESAFAALKDQDFLMIITPLGVVKDIKGTETLLEPLLATARS